MNIIGPLFQPPQKKIEDSSKNNPIEQKNIDKLINEQFPEPVEFVSPSHKTHKNLDKLLGPLSRLADIPVVQFMGIRLSQAVSRVMPDKTTLEEYQLKREECLKMIEDFKQNMNRATEDYSNASESYERNFAGVEIDIYKHGLDQQMKLLAKLDNRIGQLSKKH